MIKMVICDDRKEDRDRIYDGAIRFCREKNLQAEILCFDHPDAMIQKCEQFRPHIYILDIVMPMITGIQAARELRWNQPDAQIIFTTTEESYALESFDVNPLGYLLKPVDEKKLAQTLELALRRVDSCKEKTITVKVRGGYRTLTLSDVLYIDYRNHVVSYHLISGEVISTSTLRIGFAEYLKKNHPEADFVQCHESVAVNIASIDKLTRNDIVVRNKEMIPVSKSRYPDVADKYMSYHFAG
ncbi:MAG: LytR/AlgR family response regulator transcription factor [Lachnospiraceae bacterium]